MKTEIEKAIKTLTEKIVDETTSIEALQYTQAILNISNALRVLEDTDKNAEEKE